MLCVDTTATANPPQLLIQTSKCTIQRMYTHSYLLILKPSYTVA